MKVIPYTTSSGLQIGCRYESPKRVEYLSRDASMLQSALLSRRARSWLTGRIFWWWL